MNQEDKEFIYEFIHKNQIGVLATIDKSGKPQAAVVEFGDTPELEIVFDTLISYRKYKNLQKNRHVAFAIGFDDKETVQYEGVAEEVKGELKEKYKRIYFEKVPDAAKWDTNPEIRYFVIKPKWIRYADYSGKPYKVIELKF